MHARPSSRSCVDGIEADLRANLGTIRFKYLRADVIDRDPPKPGEPIVIEARGGGVLVLSGTATMHLTINKYPDPPQAFRATPEVELAYRRWTRFREGKEPLPAMAYFVLTLLQSLAGSRPLAASTFQIDIKVLNAVGNLSSTKGDAHSARKVVPGGVLRDLTGPETTWLEQAIQRLIHRLGEHASGAQLKAVTMAELPSI
jgi:hypothetical protein